jgi:hypothetical protein
MGKSLCEGLTCEVGERLKNHLSDLEVPLQVEEENLNGGSRVRSWKKTTNPKNDLRLHQGVFATCRFI